MSGSLNGIRSRPVLVIGDVMLDSYYHGDIERISPEAPVPVFRKKSERHTPGGAANVAANLVAAEQDVSLMALTGRDSAGDRLRLRLEQMGVHMDLLYRTDRHTTVKTRFLAGNNQQVLRLDEESTEPIDKELCGRLLALLKEKIRSFDLVLLSDYMKGLLSGDFTQGVIQMAKAAGIPAIVDVKDPRAEKYRDAWLLKPNLNELRNLTGMKAGDNDGIIRASKKLREKCRCHYVLTTCGAGGMVLVGPPEEGEPCFVPSVVREVFDVTGAGDTTIAYLAACMANGFDMREAVNIANCAAGLQVSKVGTSSVYWREIRRALDGGAEKMESKLLNGGAAARFRKAHAGQKVVFTNGCFDILHAGHVRYLREAAALGDVLVVGLNSDASVRMLKGPDRPVNSEKDRAEVLCALGFVDYVIIFDEDTPLELIRAVQPDVLVKGGDYTRETVVGVDVVEARGGELVLIPLFGEKSTTNIIRKIRKAEVD